MNCSDVEPFLDQLASDSNGVAIPDEMEMQQHVMDCAECQHSLRIRKQWNSQLSRAMIDVTVPDGLTTRLVALMGQASPHNTEQSPDIFTTPKRPLRKMAVVAAGLGLVVASIFWTIISRSTVQLSSANVAMLWEQKSEETSSESASPPRLPHGWTSLRTISAQQWKQIRLTELRMTVPVKSFELRNREEAPEEGWLFVISKSKWTPAPAASVAQARVQYSSHRVWIVWSEGDLVYVLAMTGSPQSLERMQRQLDGDRAVF